MTISATCASKRAQILAPARPLLAAVALAMLLGGCANIPFIKEFLPEGPPIPGERIAVLAGQGFLAPDPQVAGAPISLPPPSVEIDWPQQGGSASHAMTHGRLADDPQEVWTRDIGRGSDKDETLLSGPIIWGNAIYTIDNNSEITAFDAASGDEIWTVETELREERDGGWGGGIAADAGWLVATTGFGQVIGLDAGNGTELWRTSVAGPLRSSPTLDSGRVFAVTRNNKLYALSLETGEILWEHSVEHEGAGLLGTSSPAVFGDAVVVAYSSGDIFVLNAQTGSVFWTDTLASIRQVDTVSSISDIRARPVIARGRLYVSSHAGRLAAYALNTSELVWELNVGTVDQPWIAGDYLFVTSMSGEVAAIDARSGLVHWVTRIGEFENERRRKNRIEWSGPVLAGDRLLVAGGNGELLSLSPYTGDLLGRLRIRGGVTLPPILVRETLYLLTDSGKLVAYR